MMIARRQPTAQPPRTFDVALAMLRPSTFGAKLGLGEDREDPRRDTENSRHRRSVCHLGSLPGEHYPTPQYVHCQTLVPGTHPHTRITDTGYRYRLQAAESPDPDVVNRGSCILHHSCPRRHRGLLEITFRLHPDRGGSEGGPRPTLRQAHISGGPVGWASAHLQSRAPTGRSRGTSKDSDGGPRPTLRQAHISGGPVGWASAHLQSRAPTGRSRGTSKDSDGGPRPTLRRAHISGGPVGWASAHLQSRAPTGRNRGTSKDSDGGPRPTLRRAHISGGPVGWASAHLQSRAPTGRNRGTSKDSDGGPRPTLRRAHISGGPVGWASAHLQSRAPTGRSRGTSKDSDGGPRPTLRRAHSSEGPVGWAFSPPSESCTHGTKPRDQQGF